jgi:A/G-specific adenine glycosylase
VIHKDGKVFINQRPPSGLLGGLWEFPNWRIEEKQRSRLRLRLRKYIKKETGLNVEVKEPVGTFQQTYSHFKLTLHTYHCQSHDAKEKGKWVPISKLRLFPMSRIHRRIAEKIEERIM